MGDPRGPHGRPPGSPYKSSSRMKVAQAEFLMRSRIAVSFIGDSGCLDSIFWPSFVPEKRKFTNGAWTASPKHSFVAAMFAARVCSCWSGSHSGRAFPEFCLREVGGYGYI